MHEPDTNLESRLTAFVRALIDQDRAQILIEPTKRETGFWFGGGNIVEDRDGCLWLTGRYRDAGDSRTGLQAGRRGWELAIFRSHDRGRAFEKVIALDKTDLSPPGFPVLSIEGSALKIDDNRVELFVSTEKDNVGYPAEFADYLKPGTGVWSIDRLTADSVENLKSAKIEPVLSSNDPAVLHIKDPFLYSHPRDRDRLLFCSHPYNWTSSNTGFAFRSDSNDAWDPPVFDTFPRGFAWDVAMARGTCLLDVPAVGEFEGRYISVLFYDGGECVRNLEEHAAAVSRPRGYSCEELGGAAYFDHDDLDGFRRLSKHEPLFISPHGTGCSRYVDVLRIKEGFLSTWQQSQPDGSQPLVSNFVAIDEAESLLS